jgi:predicted dienelactone hydrolase
MLNRPVAILLSLSLASIARAAYDPLDVPASAKPEHLEFNVKDEKRSRDIPLRIYLPRDSMPAAVVLFSHGLGGSRDGCAYLGQHWALRGYVAVFLQHPGSDDSVWRGAPLAQRMAAMRRAADLENFRHRVHDVSAVLDQLERWNKSENHSLADRLDLNHVGMSGHSFGAVTTQAVSGQTFPVIQSSFTDLRIKAATAFSPSAPRRGDPKQVFGQVKIPWLLMTGTNDVAPIGDADVESRLAVFPALPPGGKYELVLDKAYHSAFGDRRLPGEQGEHNPKHHRAILAISTAFWDAYLREDKAARSWLDGDGPRQVLEKNDRWQKK